MKRLLFLLLTIYCINANGQTGSPMVQPFKTVYGDIQFNTPFYDLEDHWVAVAKLSKSTFVFGMVYLDSKKGYMFRVEGTFQVDTSGHVFRAPKDYPEKISTLNFYPGLKMVWAIPDAMLADLKVPAVPEWLAVYHPPTEDRNSDYYKITRGGYLNLAGSIDKAVEYLESAYITSPHAAALEYELSYAYNRLKRFTEAQTVAKAAIAYNPQSPDLYAELGFAYANNKDYDNALKTYTTGIDLAKKTNNNFCRRFITVGLVSVFEEINQYDKAVNAVNDFLPEAPDKYRSPLYNVLAEIYEKTGDNENIIKTYTKGIEVSTPEYKDLKAEMAYKLAILYRDKLKDKEQYIIWGKQAKEWAPANSDIAIAANALVF